MTTVTEATRLRIRPLGALGAEVTGGSLDPLSAADEATIKQAINQAISLAVSQVTKRAIKAVTNQMISRAIKPVTRASISRVIKAMVKASVTDMRAEGKGLLAVRFISLSVSISMT